MVIAIALLLIVAATVVFHLVTPWWLTPLASNWKSMDDTLTITVVVTGVFFVVINLFVVYTLWRFRHRTGARAAYEPDNKHLERWLGGITTLGIVALLAPGLLVYARYIDPPADAMLLEILGQQWQWRFRMPGADGKLGGTDLRFVSAENPFGLDPADPAAQDDTLIDANEVHLPTDRSVKVLTRSHDVLHDFFVPQFRARMNIVPGQVSWFWFTPTRAGRFESMCAQLCGVGHPAMRGVVVVEDETAWQAWLRQQPSFAATLAKAGSGAGGGVQDMAALGRALAQSKGCVACHTVDGRPGVGPTWQGLFGKTETFADGSTARVDEDYLRGFIRNPKARNVKGFAPVMPQIELTADELDALVAYIKTQGPAPARP
ncbi:MAG: cytochrome B [Burkholderiales bacterium RIFCSPLOWO2_12_67_14]|nr:MAG: cytochrome B [Burkholderiales bacterium RIFCSPLOWO2_02_FULL_67_64]OGB37376.1 MAG: cytochrome B [Burkholderiales bacterium RIFCSPHIGHO2_12_FULL_67_38]OGB39662.1 MAG: cytochrome B [Burkholderiales bacterium RIFCSPLOWO2_12_67_14]OGB85021.1 MAG: cytochrome B [Burkholderiales bacterium RIFCSPLOWO2_12_FULL_67_210]